MYAPLHWAAEHGNVDMVRLLIDAGADINEREQEDQFTALSVAVQQEHKEVVILLLNSGANPNLEDENGSTPLDWSSLGKNLEIARLLLQSGAKVNPKNGAKFLHWIVGQEGEDLEKVELIPLFLAAGSNVNSRNSEGYTALHTAAMCSNVEIVRALLAAGADVNAKDHLNRSTLWWAGSGIENPRIPDVVRLLIKGGANPYIKDRDGNALIDDWPLLAKIVKQLEAEKARKKQPAQPKAATP